MSFAIFDENFYLNNNPGVRQAVEAGIFSSGLEHFQQFGLAEGRVNVSPVWSEATYLASNPDVAAAVNAGQFVTGLQHYILFGEEEGRPGGPPGDFTPLGFNEGFYLFSHKDVARQVADGTYNSGLEHYQRRGQFESRTAVFNGTSGNDVVSAFGDGFNEISGIEPMEIPTNGLSLVSSSGSNLFGVGERDTLIGGVGIDTFVLGATSVRGSPLLDPSQTIFYQGEGDADFARIENLELRDRIYLSGRPNQYSFERENETITISAIVAPGVTDLIAIVEDVPGLELESFSSPTVFGFTLNRVGDGNEDTPAFNPGDVGFNEEIYLFNNPGVELAVEEGDFESGLEHYEEFGQFEGRFGAFTGTPLNDIVAGFGQQTDIIGVSVNLEFERFFISTGRIQTQVTSRGIDEVDTLIGGAGSDTFVLGITEGLDPASEKTFYLGAGDGDFALIRNFQRGTDEIVLGGLPEEYIIENIGENVRISVIAESVDLVAIVEGVTELEVVNSDLRGFSLS